MMRATHNSYTSGLLWGMEDTVYPEIDRVDAHRSIRTEFSSTRSTQSILELPIDSVRLGCTTIDSIDLIDFGIVYMVWEPSPSLGRGS